MDTPDLNKPAARSLTLQGAAAIAIAAVASRFAIHLPAGAAQNIVSVVIDLVNTLGLLGVAVGRTRANRPIA